MYVTSPNRPRATEVGGGGGEGGGYQALLEHSPEKQKPQKYQHCSLSLNLPSLHEQDPWGPLV